MLLFLQAAYLTETNDLKQQFWISAMSKRFHIIVTGESGRSFALQLSKRKLALSLSASAVTLLTICLVCYFTAGSYFNSRHLSSKVGKLNAQMELIEKNNSDYAEQIADMKKQHRGHAGCFEKETRETGYLAAEGV